MRINQGKDFTVLTDPLSFTAGLSIVGGTVNQAYDQENKSYNPSRAITPLVLEPWVQVFEDGSSTASSAASISSVIYYFGDPSDNKKVDTKTGYSVSGTKLYVSVNTSPDEPVEITAVINFVDSRTQSTYVCEKSVLLSTTYFVAHQWHVELDQPQARYIDPTRWTRDDDDALPVTIQASLYDNNTIVRDSSETVGTGEMQGNVAYQWQYVDTDGDWVNLSTECHWLMTTIPSNGHLSGTIKVNADCFDELKLRCYAKYYAAGSTYPTDVTAGRFAECYLKRQLPKTAWVDTICDQGSYISNPSDTTAKIKMHVSIHDNESEITDVDKYYRVQWWKKSHATGSTETKIAEGYSLEVNVADLGITRNQGLRIYPLVYELGAFLPIQAGVGQTVDGYTVPILLTTTNGSYVVAQQIKIKS